MAELPTGWGQTNSNSGNPLLSVPCLFYLFLKWDCFQSFHLSQLLPLAGSGDKSSHNNLKWKCWHGKGQLPDRRHVPCWLPGQSSPAHPQPEQWGTKQLYYYNSTIKQHSIQLGRMQEAHFQNQTGLTGRTSLIWAVGAVRTQAGFRALTTLAQDCCWLPRDCSSLSPQLLEPGMTQEQTGHPMQEEKRRLCYKRFFSLY